MSRREASLVLGVSPTASKIKVKVRVYGRKILNKLGYRPIWYPDSLI